MPIAARHFRWPFAIVLICVLGRLLGGPVWPPEPISPWVESGTSRLPPLHGEPGPSLVDRDAPVPVQFCQELAYFLYLITETTYAEYVANHDRCAPEPAQLAAGWDECCPELVDPDTDPETLLCMIAARLSYLLAEMTCEQYETLHEACLPE